MLLFLILLCDLCGKALSVLGVELSVWKDVQGLIADC